MPLRRQTAEVSTVGPNGGFRRVRIIGSILCRMSGSIERRRAKISVTVDRDLLRAVDSYVERHEGLDRSKVIDRALLAWYAARQDEAMIEQYTASSTEDQDAEYTAWTQIRDAAASDMLSRPHDEG